MTERTFSKPLPSPATSISWPEDTGTKMGRVARTGATLPLMPFVRPKSLNRKGPVKYEWEAIGRDGQSHDFIQVFRPGNNMNLPGPTAGRVIMALLSKSPGPGDQSPQISTHLDELAEICRLDKNQLAYGRIRKALERLQGAKIESNSFWDYADQKYMKQHAIGLFSSGHSDITSSKAEFDVQWSSGIVDLMRTWTRPINLNHLFGLDTCLARKLYRVSTLGIYQQGELVEDLRLLCHGHLGISQNREYPSQLKQSLSRPIESLREKNLIDVTIEKDTENPSIKSDWLVRARPMEGMLEINDEIEDPQYWACHLANRGMMDLKDDPVGECRKWVDKKGVPRVRTVVQEFDRRRSEASDAKKVRHPGWMLEALRNDTIFEKDEEEKSRVHKRQGGMEESYDGDKPAWVI